MPFSHRERAAHLAGIESRPWDLVVIGGGITGAGIAHEAATRGLTVAVLEKGDLASGTSSASSKLVHGGLRYLEQLQIALVREAVRERFLLTQLAPHLVQPIGFLLPLYRSGRHRSWKVRLGLWAYERLTGGRGIGGRKNLSVEEVGRLEPALRRQDLSACYLYHDCQTDDARLTLAAARAAADAGAAILTRCEVAAGIRESGRLARLAVRDLLGGGTFEVRARLFVLAAGPWTDVMRERLGLAGPPAIRPTQGSHLVLPAARAPIQNAVAVTHPKDRRVMFLIPWGSHTMVGTTDTDHAGPPEPLAASRADVEYLLESYNHYCPEHPAALEDVTSTWAGLRPLVNEQGKKASQVSREHLIAHLEPGLLAIVGGKLTTFRVMARQVVERAAGEVGPLAPPPEPRPYPGGEAPPDIVLQRTEFPHALPPAARASLAARHGARAEALVLEHLSTPADGQPIAPPLPYVMGEVDWAVEEELVLSLTDFLRRRTQIFYKAADQGLGCAERVAARLAVRLGWDAARVAAEVAAYRVEVGRSRAFRGSSL